jgi:class 3 adenylate cyclase
VTLLIGEEMRNIVNQCFTEVIDVIQAHGGDVLKFAGDALFAVWPAAECTKKSRKISKNTSKRKIVRERAAGDNCRDDEGNQRSRGGAVSGGVEGECEGAGEGEGCRGGGAGGRISKSDSDGDGAGNSAGDGAGDRDSNGNSDDDDDGAGPHSDNDPPLDDQVLRAAQCGVAVQARVDDFGDAKLRLKITAGAHAWCMLPSLSSA